MVRLKKNRKNKQYQQTPQHLNICLEQQDNISSFSQYNSTSDDSIDLKQPSLSTSIFNFVTSANLTNSSVVSTKEASVSAAATTYTFLDDFHSPNLSSYYSMALCQ
jgi:hypothetical protein